jgi:hypothetical protein
MIIIMAESSGTGRPRAGRSAAWQAAPGLSPGGPRQRPGPTRQAGRSRLQAGAVRSLATRTIISREGFRVPAASHRRLGGPLVPVAVCGAKIFINALLKFISLIA